MLTRVDPPLDRTVVLFQDVTEVRHRPVPAAGVQRSFTLELSDRGWVSGVTIGVDDPRSGLVLSTQGFGQEALCCGRVLLGREEKVKGRAGEIHRPIQVAPFAFHPDIGLVHAPAVVGRFELRAQTAFHFRGLALHPPPDGDMIGVQGPISEQFLNVSVRKREVQIPADGQEDHLRFELPPLEKTAN
jgi:hypothetical protein